MNIFIRAIVAIQAVVLARIIYVLRYPSTFTFSGRFQKPEDPSGKFTHIELAEYTVSRSKMDHVHPFRLMQVLQAFYRNTPEYDERRVLKDTGMKTLEVTDCRPVFRFWPRRSSWIFNPRHWN